MILKFKVARPCDFFMAFPCVVYVRETSIFDVHTLDNTLYSVYIIHCMQYILFTIQCINFTLFIVYTIHCIRYTLYSVLYTLHDELLQNLYFTHILLLYTLHTAHYSTCSIWFNTSNIVQCKLFLYTLHCTHTVHKCLCGMTPPELKSWKKPKTEKSNKNKSEKSPAP